MEGCVARRRRVGANADNQRRVAPVAAPLPASSTPQAPLRVFIDRQAESPPAAKKCCRNAMHRTAQEAARHHLAAFTAATPTAKPPPRRQLAASVVAESNQEPRKMSPIGDIPERDGDAIWRRFRMRKSI
jgi:hypothetical protein